MDLAQIRQDIANILTNVGQFRVLPTVPDSTNGSTAVIAPETFQYHDTYGGGENPQMTIMFLVPAIGAQSVQNQIDAWISTGTNNSVVDALEQDSRFRVAQLRNYQGVLLGDPQSAVRCYSAELVVDVLDS